ncbi:MAG: J domain-containing protein [Legionellaceae bacterium]|nr:J domain-containing protein [Legionellaceae bacterium]
MPGFEFTEIQDARDALGIKQHLTAQEITTKFRVLALINQRNKPEGYNEKFQELIKAKNTLNTHAQTFAEKKKPRLLTPLQISIPNNGLFRTNLDRIITKIYLTDKQFGYLSQDMSISKENIKLFALRITTKTPSNSAMSSPADKAISNAVNALWYLNEILEAINPSNDAHNHTYITQELLDFLLAQKTDIALEHVHCIFRNLLSAGHINTSTVNTIINLPDYVTIFANTLEHFINKMPATGTHKALMNEGTTFILDFYNFFPVDSMESITFEAELLAAHTIADIDTVIQKYQVVLQNSRARDVTYALEEADLETEPSQERDPGGEEETKRQEEPEQQEAPTTNLPEPKQQLLNDINTMLNHLKDLSSQVTQAEYTEERNNLATYCDEILDTHELDPAKMYTPDWLTWHYEKIYTNMKEKISALSVGKPKSWEACETLDEQCRYIMHEVIGVMRSFLSVITLRAVNAENHHDHYFFQAPCHEKPDVQQFGNLLSQLNQHISEMIDRINKDNTYALDSDLP